MSEIACRNCGYEQPDKPDRCVQCGRRLHPLVGSIEEPPQDVPSEGAKTVHA